MTSSDIYWVLSDINRFSAVPGILFFLFALRGWRSNAAIIFYILFISFFFDFTIFIYIKYFYPNSYFGSNWWIIINYFLMSWFFVRVIPPYKALIQLMIIVFTISAIISFVWWYSFFESNTVIRTFSSISFLFLSILGFRELAKQPAGNLLKMPTFYALSAFILYYSLTFLKGVFQQHLVFELEVTSDQFFIIGVGNLIVNTAKNYTLFYVLILLSKRAYDPILNPDKNV